MATIEIGDGGAEERDVEAEVGSGAADFVQKSLSELQEREASFRRLAYLCYSVAYLTLVATVGLGIWRTLVQVPATRDWQVFAQLATPGVIVLSLLIGLAKYAFTLGKSFMVEALRNADRRHAISFGAFFLRGFGATAKWPEVKDAFQNWNIDSGSHFISQNQSDFDPQILLLAMELAKGVSGKSRGADS